MYAIFSGLRSTFLLFLLGRYFSEILFLETFKSFCFSTGLGLFSWKSGCTYMVWGLGKVFSLIGCNSVNFYMHLSRPIEDDRGLA